MKPKSLSIFLYGALLIAGIGLLLTGAIAGPRAAPPPPSSEKALPPIHVAVYEGVINPVAAEYLIRAIRDANEAGAALLVIRMDTPGGLDTSMREIIKEMSGSAVPIAVYVSPTGARAASAGVFITLAAHVAAMAPGTNIGAAHPVAMGGGQMDETMREKVENDAAAYIRSIAEKRGRNARWAEDAVRESVSATEQEALRLRIIDLVAENQEALLQTLHGRKVATVAGERTLATRGAAVVETPMGTRLRILNLLSDPNVAYILMILGIYGLFFELASPGAILPGVVGAICLILAFYAFQTLPVNYAGLMLIVLGIILFIAEIKITSYGMLTVAGIIAMVLGSLMLIETDVPFFKISWAVILPMVIATALFFSVAVGLAIRAHKRKSISGREGMIGLTGEAATDLAPEGKVFLHGELWDARSAEAVRAGEKVEVLEMDGLILTVKKSGGSYA